MVVDVLQEDRIESSENLLFTVTIVPEGFAQEFKILVGDCRDHRQPFPCEPGWKAQPVCLPDGGEMWHLYIDWRVCTSCTLCPKEPSGLL